MEIDILNLNKKYGKVEALKNVNLKIGKGLYGLLGRNGAGKTTLLRILATLISKSDGEIFINGISITNSKKIRKIIGYLPQNFSTYPNMSVWKSMEYFDLLSEMPVKTRKKRIEILLKQVNLWEKRKCKVKHLSGGMRQRLGVIREQSNLILVNRLFYVILSCLLLTMTVFILEKKRRGKFALWRYYTKITDFVRSKF